MNAAAPAPKARYPQNWLTPTRNAPEPPVVAMSASEWPANDWPLVTVNTPTTAEVIAMTVPTARAMCTGPLAKKPGSKMCPMAYLTAVASSATAAASSTPSAATTRTRPCTRITSTCLPYRRLSTSGWTTSSVLPTATRPAAT